jgi:predicted ATP-grasp superfamily ATP-dependent carboligase
LAADARAASTIAAPRASVARALKAAPLAAARSVRQAWSTRPLRALIEGAQGYPIAAAGSVDGAEIATGPRKRRSPLRPVSAPRVDALVVDAALRQALVCTRSLGRAGLAVGLLETRPAVPAFRSRWCAVNGVVPDYGPHPDDFVEAVVERAQRHGARALFASHDGSIEVLRARRAEVERHVALALADEPALAVAVAKDRTLALAAGLGIGIPRSVAVTGADDVRAAANELGFPLIVKPNRSWVHERTGSRLACTLAVDLPEALRVVEQLVQVGGAPIVQEWLVGSREAVSLFRADGRVLARFAQVAHRMDPPLGGSSVVRESIPLPPDITDAAERLVDACDLDGYSEVEFRRDADGRPRLMEINPRLSASGEIAVRAGVDFPLLLYRWAVGEKLIPVGAFRTGVRMRWLGGDVRWLRRTLASQGRPDAEPALRAIGSFCADFFRPASYDYVDVDDMRPATAAAASWIRGATAAAKSSLRHPSRRRRSSDER